MHKEKIKQLISIIKERLAGGLLCCLVLAVAYLFQYFFSEVYIDALSSSYYLTLWMIIFVGAALWTIREKETKALPAEVTDWQCIAAFLLVVSSQIYNIMPKEIHASIAPIISVYTIPVFAIVCLTVTGLIKFSISIYHLLENERRQAALERQRLQEILSCPPTEKKEISLVRNLLENQSIAQFSAKKYLLLVEECRIIDPVLFAWLSDKNLKVTSRDIVLFVLIRMRKTKEEILSIFSISESSYRTMKSRARDRLCLENHDLETFLQAI